MVLLQYPEVSQRITIIYLSIESMRTCDPRMMIWVLKSRMNREVWGEIPPYLLDFLSTELFWFLVFVC